MPKKKKSLAQEIAELELEVVENSITIAKLKNDLRKLKKAIKERNILGCGE